ncbi:MAG: hypothetical protein U5K76_15135 [Woeseiaceae bacterium]|nr:hypothetical protein [Woeseiaceae bacterium]
MPATARVAHLRRDLPRPELALLWVAPTGSVTAPFLPWWIGVDEVPPEFGQHRYLTENSSSTFINPAFQLREASEFAGRLFKRLMYLTCAYPEDYLARVQGTLAAFEATMLEQQPRIERMAELALAEDRELGRELLTIYSQATRTRCAGAGSRHGGRAGNRGQVSQWHSGATAG